MTTTRFDTIAARAACAGGSFYHHKGSFDRFVRLLQLDCVGQNRDDAAKAIHHGWPEVPQDVLNRTLAEV